jgi:hypothetical protein
MIQKESSLFVLARSKVLNQFTSYKKDYLELTVQINSVSVKSSMETISFIKGEVI